MFYSHFTIRLYWQMFIFSSNSVTLCVLVKISALTHPYVKAISQFENSYLTLCIDVL